MNIIEIKKQHIGTATATLANAFIHDPIFRYIFRTREKYLQAAPWMFSTWIKWSMLYGKAWMTEDGNTVLLTRVPGRAKMTLWSMIRAGMLATPLKIGIPAFRRFYFEVVELLDRKNAEIMGDAPHWYGWMIGLNNQHTGHSAAPLLSHFARTIDASNLPIYLETESKVHVRMYSSYHFKLAGETKVADDLTIYFMVRQPQNTSAL